MGKLIRLTVVASLYDYQGFVKSDQEARITGAQVVSMVSEES